MSSPISRDDTSATFVIGDAPPHAGALVELARGARDAGIATAVPGGRLGDIGAAIVRHVGDSGARPAWQRTLSRYAERIGVSVDDIR